jgi:hypothetical protein
MLPAIEHTIASGQAHSASPFGVRMIPVTTVSTSQTCNVASA